MQIYTDYESTIISLYIYIYIYTSVHAALLCLFVVRWCVVFLLWELGQLVVEGESSTICYIGNGCFQLPSCTLVLDGCHMIMEVWFKHFLSVVISRGCLIPKLTLVCSQYASKRLGTHQLSLVIAERLSEI